MQATIIVESSSELLAALLELSNDSGGIIKLLPSEKPYSISGDAFGSSLGNITLLSGDPDRPAEVSVEETSVLRSLTFDGVSVVSAAAAYEVAPEDVLAKLVFEDGQVLDDSLYAKEIAVQSGDAGGVTAAGTFLLDGSSKIVIPREQMRGQQDFTVALSLKPGDAVGTFFDMHTQVRAWVTDAGAISAFAKTDAGIVVITTAEGLVNDGDWHRIAIAFDGGAGGSFTLYVDGQEAATAEVDGQLSKLGTYPVVIGNTWNDSIHAEVSEVEIQAGAWTADMAGQDAAPDVHVDLPVTDAEPTDVPPENILSKLVFDGGKAVDASIYGKEVVVQSGETGGVTGDGTFLLDGKSKIIISRDQMRDQQDFAVALSLKPGDAKGTFFDMHTQVRAWVTADGAISAFAKTDAGMVVITTAAGLVNDGGWHRIGLSFDGGEGGIFTLYVDGQEAATAEVSGELTKMGTYPPVIGSSWGQSIQAEVRDVEIQSEPWTTGQVESDSTPPAPVPDIVDDVQDAVEDLDPSVPSETDGARSDTGEDAGIDADDAVIDIDLPDAISAPGVTLPSSILNWLGSGAVIDAAPVVEKVLGAFDGKTITVSTDAELASAIAQLSAGSGGRILLVNTGTDYTVSGKGLGHATENILITSADPEDPAVIKSVDITKATNLTFDNLQFNGDADAGSGKVVSIYSSSDIVVSNSLFLGSSSGFVSDSATDDVGRGSMMVRWSTDVQIIGNEFSHMGSGIGVIDSSGTVISDNDFHHLVFDGLQMSGVVDTLVENNIMHDFYYSTQVMNHSDFIQLFSASWNTLSTENLIIRGNQLLSTGEYGSQSIFMRNEDYERGDGALYKNIVIEDNTILNGNQNAIFVGDAVGVSVANNTVLWNPDALIYHTAGAEGGNLMPLIRLNRVEGATVTDNITGAIWADGADISGNIIVDYKQLLSDDYIGNNLVNATELDASRDIRDLRILATSSWVGKGSSAIQPQDADAEPTAVIRHAASDSTPGAVVFDATESFGFEGTVVYHWTFSDGTQATGAKVTHRFAEGDTVTATLKIVSEDGSAAEVTRNVSVTHDAIVSIDFNSGITDNSTNQIALTSSGSVVGGAFALDGSSKVAITDPAIYNQQTFTIALSLKLDSAGESGTFLDMHTYMRAKVNTDGSVTVWVATEDGKVILTSAPGLVSDTDWHRIAFSFEGGDDGALTLFIDGQEAGQADVSSPMVASANQSLVLGNTWHASLEGQIDDMSMLGRAYDADWAAQDEAETLGGASARLAETVFSTLIEGTDGADILAGHGTGADLTGGEGQDLFLLETGAGTLDRIMDFTAGEDLIVLDAATFGVTAGSGLSAAQFAASAADVTAGTRFYMDNDTLWFDADGSGAADAVALAAFDDPTGVGFDSMLFV